MANDWTKLTLEAGDRVAGFEIESFVARGGMAVVYRARDISLGRTVALKVIAPELAQNEKFRLRFMRESELAASLDHPNVIPIYGAGEEDDLLYLVMRFVRGDDLGTVLRQGPLSPRVALPIFTQVAGGLDAAHARQLIHRDVKPGNILLAGEDDVAQRHVYLSDFGLTKRLSSLTGVTTAGHFLGTIHYVAPEQVESKPVDHRSDIYSFGCVLFEALAGEPPFAGEDDAALLWAHIAQDPPRISDRRPDLPAALDPVLQRALAKDPDDRPQDCRTLVSELRMALRSGANRGGTPPGRPRPPARPKPAAAEQRRPPARPAGGRTPATSAEPNKKRPVRTVRRPKLGLLGLIAALILLVGGGGWLLLGPDPWVSRSGTELSEAAVALEHPKSWAPKDHGGQFIVLAPTDLTGIFTPGGDWAAAQRTLQEEPTDLVGAYVTTTQAFEVGQFTPLEDQLSHQFTGVEFQSKDPQDPPPGAPSGTERVSGTLQPAGGTEPVLFYDLVVQPASSPSARPGAILLFCRAEDRAANQETFDRVLASMRTL
jgi:hypothetical protein